MNVHAFICTRSTNHSQTTDDLLDYLVRAGVTPHLLVNKTSIFSAYASELESVTDKNDIVVMCHDDIEILNDIRAFKDELMNNLEDPKCGFVGVAGTSKLLEGAVWWDQKMWGEGRHSGTVFHGKHRSEMGNTFYGIPAKCVVMDGLFLAAKARTLKKVGLEKPKKFPGDWDFYDLYYTAKAYDLGYYNKVVPILLRHESVGSLAGRDSWHDNRKEFMKMFRLPLTCHK